MLIKAVIFDMDGLMFDTERLNKEKMEEVLTLYGYKIYDEIFYKTIGVSKYSAINEFISFYGYNFPYKKIFSKRREIINDYIETNGVPIKYGLIELINYLKDNKIKIVVATSSYRKLANFLLSKANIINDIDFLVCGDDINNSKPAPDIFLKALEISDTKPCDAVVLEDSAMGIIAANKANIKAIVIPDIFPTKEEIKKICFREFTNLKLVKEFLIKNNNILI